MKGNYLITCDNWFVAPDGKQYKAAWGRIKVKSDDSILGIRTNRNSTNWYIELGVGEDSIVIAGCQIHYAVKYENQPNFKTVEVIENGEKRVQDCLIYNANGLQV